MHIRRRGCWFSWQNVDELIKILEEEVPQGNWSYPAPLCPSRPISMVCVGRRGVLPRPGHLVLGVEAVVPTLPVLQGGLHLLQLLFQLPNVKYGLVEVVLQNVKTSRASGSAA
ncbi:hypothetical protein SGLAM104S_00001 [Streptomyces glaucescens]